MGVQRSQGGQGGQTHPRMAQCAAKAQPTNPRIHAAATARAALALALLLAQGYWRSHGVPELGALIAQGRDRDLNNDGLPDSGMDQWTADLFHTRDMVRQSALEHIQFVRLLRSAEAGITDDDGRVLFDVDGDGEPELGGPDVTLGAWGISLGGIVTGVLAGAEPSLDAVSPNAGGAGLTDISARSSQAGVPQAVVMPMLGPIVAGCLPTDDHQNPIAVGESTDADCWDGRGQEEGPYTGGTLRLGFVVHDQARTQRREFAQLEGVEAGDRVVLTNLSNGETEETVVQPRGWFRLSVAADALNPIERRPVLGLTGDMPGPATATDPTLLGDAMRVDVYVGDSEELRGSVDSFGREVEFQGTIYPADSTLVTLQEGLGYERNTPGFRRFTGIAQHALGPADPAVWTAHAFLEPLDMDYDPHRSGGNTRVLVMPTAGDSNVPVNTGIAMGRTAGVLGSWLRDEERYGPEEGWRELYAADPRYGHAIDQELVDRYVVEGDPLLQRFGDHDLNPNVIYDIDDVSDGVARFSCGDSDWSALIGEYYCPEDIDGQEVFFDVPEPSEGDALRADWPRGDGTYDAFRVPLLRPAGQHGIYNAQAFRVFDADAYMVSFTIRYLLSAGARVDHLEGCDCIAEELPVWITDGEEEFPEKGEACTEDDLKLCDETCAEGWGLVHPPVTECATP